MPIRDENPLYIRAENSVGVDLREYGIPYVMPHTEDTTWQLCVKKTEDEDTVIVIASFENVEKANDALTSLKEAIDLGKGWDAIFHKEKVQRTPIQS